MEDLNLDSILGLVGQYPCYWFKEETGVMRCTFVDNSQPVVKGCICWEANITKRRKVCFWGIKGHPSWRESMKHKGLL